MVGGDGGVVQQVNPNDPVIVCPIASAPFCSYYSSTTGMWDATASNGTSTTTWTARNEEMIWSGLFLATVDWAGDVAPDPGDAYGEVCIRSNEAIQHYVWTACNQEYEPFNIPSDLTLTRMTVVNRQPWLTNTGCDFRLTTANGATPIANAEIIIPDQDGVAHSGGTITEVSINTTIPAGTFVQIQGRDGTNCPATGTCECDIGAQRFWMNIFGVIK